MANALEWVVGSPYLLVEDFENPSTGYSSGYTWVETPGTGGSINPKNTSSPLLGTQDCKIVSGNAGQQSFTTVDIQIAIPEIWAYFQFMVDTAPTVNDSRCFTFGKADGTEEASMFVRTAGNGSTLYISSNSQNGITVSTYSTATKYHVWLHFRIDGTGDIGFSTTGTRPTSGNSFASYTGGFQDPIEIIRLRGENQSTFQFDRVIISNYQIGDNP